MQRDVSTKLYIDLFQKCRSQNPNVTISYGNFVQLKPFYITCPTSREKASCLCINYQNAHNIYDTLRFNVKEIDFPSSLTSYLTSTVLCEDDEDIQFPHIECLTIVYRMMVGKPIVTDVTDLIVKIYSRHVTNRSGKRKIS